MALHYVICRPVRKLTNTNILIISAGTTATPAYSGMARPLDQIPPVTAIKGKCNNILGDIEKEP